MSDPSVLFLDRGEGHFHPTELCRGPWAPDALHGGAPAALLAGELEHALAGPDPEHPMLPARLTIDLERPVGLVPMIVRTAVVRPGRKVRIADAELFDERGNRLARASMLGIRRTAGPLDHAGAITGEAVPPPPLPAERRAVDAPSFLRVSDLPMFHADAVEHRMVRGAMGVPGPASDWIRLIVGVVDGRPVTPIQRVAAAADFGNGVGSALPPGWVFINPDLTITLHRLPEGEWVCVDAATYLGPDGTGTAESQLWDERGRLGRGVQTLVVEPPG